MQKNELISVLIPAYNHECFIGDTIRSIFDQDYDNIELLVIDDGSTDCTWDEISKLKPICEKRFSNVVFRRQENSGLCQTLNALISMAKGVYLYILASDDIAKPNALSTLHSFLSTHNNYSLVMGDNEIIDESNNRIYWTDIGRNGFTTDINQARFLTFADWFQKFRKLKYTSRSFGSYSRLLRQGNHLVNGWLIRRSVLDCTGLYTPKAPLEDWFMAMQISKHAKIKFIDQTLCMYRWHTNNTMRDSDRVNDLTRKTLDYEIGLMMQQPLREMRLSVRVTIVLNRIYFYFKRMRKRDI